MKNKVQGELKGHFKPEFLNRVDDIVVVHQLEREEIFRIVDLMIAKVDDRLKDRDMAIELRPAAKDLLSQRGYDPVLGARPLRRTIQREIEDNLSEKILFGELRPGQIVIVDTEGSGETAKFTFTGVPKPSVVDDVPAPEMASEPGDVKGSAAHRLACGAQHRHQAATALPVGAVVTLGPAPSRPGRPWRAWRPWRLGRAAARGQPGALAGHRAGAAARAGGRAHQRAPFHHRDRPAGRAPGLRGPPPLGPP